MFPISAMISKEIYLGGFDGRDLNEKISGNIQKKQFKRLMNIKKIILAFLMIGI